MAPSQPGCVYPTNFGILSKIWTISLEGCQSRSEKRTDTWLFVWHRACTAYRSEPSRFAKGAFVKNRFPIGLIFLAVIGSFNANASDSDPQPPLIESFPVSLDQRPRLLLEMEAGTETSLGYKFPSTDFGPAIEIPAGKRFEFQGGAAYSPDRKEITNDGQSLKLSASGIVFATERLGLVGTLERSWLWTSQFNEHSWYPGAGIVLRNDYWGPGRLYLTYLFPTGCVWAIPANPCTLQSKRLQGPELEQQVRSSSHIRWGFRGGVYHFCDQANPYEPQLGRNCHWGATAMASLNFEFHLGRRPRFMHQGASESDNF